MDDLCVVKNIFDIYKLSSIYILRKKSKEHKENN